MIIKNFRPKPSDTTIVVGEENQKYLHISGEKYQEPVRTRLHQINKDAQRLSKLAHSKMTPAQRVIRAKKAAARRWVDHKKKVQVFVCKKQDIKET